MIIVLVSLMLWKVLVGVGGVKEVVGGISGEEDWQVAGKDKEEKEEVVRDTWDGP